MFALHSTNYLNVCICHIQHSVIILMANFDIMKNNFFQLNINIRISFVALKKI